MVASNTSTSNSNGTLGPPPFPVPTLNTNDVLNTLFPIGGFVVAFTFVSLVVKEKLFVSDALVATVFGVILGPYVAKFFDPFAIEPTGTYLIILYVFSEFLLVVQIVAAAITLDRDFWSYHWPSFTILLGPVTLGMFLVTTLLVWGIAGLPFLDAMLVGAACSPTDPVLANSIVKGRFADLHVSPTVRDLLSAESAANDGMGYPFLMLAIYLIRYYYSPAASTTTQSTVERALNEAHFASRAAAATSSPTDNTTTTSTGSIFTPPNAHTPGQYPSAGSATLAWFIQVILYQILVAVVLGLVIGYVSRKTLRYTESKGWIDKETMLGFAIALSAFLLGLGNVLNISGFVLSVVAGVVFSWDNFFYHRVQDSHIQEVIDMLLTAVFFIFFGSCIPWAAMNTPELPIWRLFLLSIAVLALRRLPVVLLLYPTLRSLINHKEAYFVGYFGPIGVAAIWYMTLVRETCPESSPLMVPICFWLVLTSVIGHGLSVPFVHLGILTYSRSRDPQLRGPRGPRGWTGSREGLVIGPPIMRGPVPDFSRAPPRRSSVGSESGVVKDGNGRVDEESPETAFVDGIGHVPRSSFDGANNAGQGSGGFQVYDLEEPDHEDGGLGRRRSGSMDSSRSRGSGSGSGRIVRASSGDIALGMGIPVDRQNTVKFVDSIRPVSAKPGILVTPTYFSSGDNNDEISRPRSTGGVSLDRGETPDQVLGLGIPYQRYHSRAISFEVPDRTGGRGRRHSGSADSRSLGSADADDERAEDVGSKYPKYKRSRSLGVEEERAARRGTGLGGLSATWSPRNFFNSIGGIMAFRRRSSTGVGENSGGGSSSAALEVGSGSVTEMEQRSGGSLLPIAGPPSAVPVAVVPSPPILVKGTSGDIRE